MKQPEVYKVYVGQLERIDEALDAVMASMRILRGAGDEGPLVDLETVASVLSLAHSAIAETTDDIREGGR